MARVVESAADQSPRVRFQVAFSLGEVSGSTAAEGGAVDGLATIARRDGEDTWIRTAILSSSHGGADPLILELVRREISQGGACDATLLRQLAFFVGRGNDNQKQVTTLLEELDDSSSTAGIPTLQAILLGLSDGLRGAGTSMQELRTTLIEPASQLVDRIVEDALNMAVPGSASPSLRNQAILVLSCGDYEKVAGTLAAILTPQEPEALKRAAVQALATFDNPQAAAALLAPWRQYTPPIREAVAQALFGRPAWLEQFLAAIERGEVAANNITKVQRGMMLASRDKELRARAEKLFEVDTSPRSEVYDRYRPALEMVGTATAGEKVYERECMACHQIGAKGQAVGPNLALTKHRTPEELLLHILDPNREVQPAFIQYMVVDRAGGIYSGLIAAETSTSITLRRDKGVEQTILKQEIDEISSGDKSLMPEGFEKTIDAQQMADLLVFLKELHYDIGTNPGRGGPEDGLHE